MNNWTASNCVLQLSDPAALLVESVSAVRKRGTNGNDSTADKATRLRLPNMVIVEFSDHK